MNQINKQRIAKNTVMLYIRMIIITIVTLYTSRIILDVLGVVDYGIYNVVGGIVVMLGFISAAMSSAIQRFLSFELGRKDIAQYEKVFSTAVIVQIIIALIILVIAETVGLWFLNNRMIIPPDRMIAANWVYQFSVLTFITKILCVPYNASIISYEKMNIYAYISLVEAGLLLCVVFLLKLSFFDKLSTYAILYFIVVFVTISFYRYYCIKKLDGCRFRYTWNRSLLKEMLSFCGWSLFGGFGSSVRYPGVNVVLNIFFGPVVNAAWGISMQVKAATATLITSFTTALNPPIVKSYAVGDYRNTSSLLFTGMRFSFFLASCIIFPFMISTEEILNIWLTKIPEYTVAFVQMALVCSLVDTATPSIIAVIQATGKVKLYQIVIGILLVLNIPLAYLLLKFDQDPVIVVYALVFIITVSYFVRLILLYRLFKFEMKELWFVFRSMGAITIVNILPYVIKSYFGYGIVNFIVVSFISVLLTGVSFYYLGMTKNERLSIVEKLCKRD